jgi:hypothetical protein
MRWTYLMVAAPLLTGACVSTNAALMNPTVKLAPVCPNGVALFTSPDKVGKAYTEVAILNAKGESGWTSEEGMYNSMRKKAAGLGANGVILNDIKEAGAGAKVAGAIFGTGTERKGSSIAISVPGDSARVREACATVVKG